MNQNPEITEGGYKNSGTIFERLWTKVYESLGRCMGYITI